MDFRKLGIGFEELGGRIVFGEAIDLVAELRRDWGSHLSAAEAGWQHVASYGEVSSALLAHHFKQVHYKQPTPIPFPWDPPPEVVTAEERTRAAAILATNGAKFAEDD